MQAGDFEAAQDLLAHILQEDPDHQDALYASAVCARYLKRHDGARTYLQRLKEVAPDLAGRFRKKVI